jgi:starch synthase
MSKVLMVASEAVPFAKSGGLADVIGALPQALVAQGDDVAVVLPRYGSIPLTGAQRVAEGLAVWFGADSYPTEIFVVVQNGVPFFLVDCPALYDRDGLYTTGGISYPDNHLRFAVLCRSALNVIRYLYRPQIVHCHEWQTALIAPYVRYNFANDPTFLGIKLVMSLHNLGYQGIFAPEELDQVGLDRALFASGILELDGSVNFLQAGIRLADAITTVSPGYAREIQTPEFGNGLDELLRERNEVLTGILNGVDYSHWNPETDEYIAANYSAQDLRGKRQCKIDLLREFGLPEDDLERPVIGVVSRFTSQKGFDLIEEIAPELAEEDLYLVALGTGEPHYEDLFRGLAAEHADRIAVRIAYDNVLAHKIEAGADMFLMPSHYEPCGLNQIYSLRYGTVPIVRATGGLDDTIDAETGFKFKGYEAPELLAAIQAALTAYGNPAKWRKMMQAGMAKDYSWTSSAAKYSQLYRDLLA